MVEIRMKEGVLDFYFPSPFEQYLQGFFGSRKKSFAMYWGGINGAINRKIGWTPEHETWLVDDDGLVYAESTNEIMSEDTTYSFVGLESRGDELYNMTKSFISEYDVNPAFIDINSCDSLFDIEHLIKGHDMVFIKNVTMDVVSFLSTFRVLDNMNYIYLFYTEKESKKIMEDAKKQGKYSEGIMHVNELYD